MRCTCGKTGTILLKRREFPYCEECFRHMVVRLFRHEAGDGPVYLRASRNEKDAFYRGAIDAIATEARRETCTAAENETGAMTPGCAERAAASAIAQLFSSDPLAAPERIFPTTITREELERFFKPAPNNISDAVEDDLRTLETRYPGTIASVLRSVGDRNRTA